MGEKLTRVLRSEIKSINEKDFTVDVVMSDQTVDRYKEVIKATAWKKHMASYKAHPILLSSHNYHGLMNQIGESSKIGVKEDALRATFKYYAASGNPEADWAWVLASKGVAAYSVGFIRHAGRFVDPDEKYEDDEEMAAYQKAGVRYVYDEVELLECSHVTVPANPACLQDSFDQGVVMRDLEAKAYPLMADLEAALKLLSGIGESKAAIPYKKHPLAPKDMKWDAGPEVAAADVNDLEVMCAWMVTEAPAELKKGDFKLPHHTQKGYNTVWKGVANAAARLSQAKIPSGDVKGVQTHLEKHYTEFKEKAPWAKSAEMWQRWCDDIQLSEEEFKDLFGIEISEFDGDMTRKWDETANEIRHRVREPGLFSKFRYITLQTTKPVVRGILGKLKTEDKWLIQSLRFSKSEGWDMAKAKKWVADHPDVLKEINEEEIIMKLDDLEEMVESLKVKFTAELETLLKSGLDAMTAAMTVTMKIVADEVAKKTIEAFDEALKKQKEIEVAEVVGDTKKDEVITDKKDTDSILDVFKSVTEEMKIAFKAQS